MKNRGRIVVSLLLGIAIIGAVASIWLPRYFEAAWFLQDLNAGSGTSDWKALHRPPTRSVVSWTVEGHGGEGDLYTPAEAIRGRVIFVPGLLVDARNDERVIATAFTLARAGFLTLVPETTAYNALKASPADIAAITDAGLWLAGPALPDKPPDQIGIVALSYMSGPAILAAARAPLAEKVKFVFFIGGYYSMTDMIRFITTRKFRAAPGDPWSEEPPADYATWAFLKANAMGMENAADGAALAAIADAKLAHGDADVTALVGALGPEGRSVYDLIANRDPDRVEALIAALPQGLRTQFDALDPSKQDLSGFQGEALLVHGKDDPLIASVESGKLAAALGDKAHLYILEQVTHVEMNRPASLWDQLDLLFAARRLLSYRD